MIVGLYDLYSYTNPNQSVILIFFAHVLVYNLQFFC